MPSTTLTASGVSDGYVATSGNDGTMVLQVGPNGAKVNAISIAADGTPTFIKLPVNPVQSMIRLNTTNGFGSTNTVIRRWLNITSTQGTDITYTDSATLGATFTINVTGVYAFMYNDVFGVATNFGLSLNSSQLTTAFDSININDRLSYAYTSGTDFTGVGGGTFYLAAGSIVRCHVGSATNSVVPARSAFAVTRVA